MAANIKKVRITNYMKNVGRSVGVVVIDAAKDYNPVIANIISGSKDSFREAKDAIKNIGNTELFKGVQDTINGGASNLLNDIKSGNIAADHSMDGMFGDMDFDFDSDFSSSDEDWGDEDTSSSSASAVEEQAGNVSAVMKSTLVAHKDTMVMTSSITTATAKSANHIAKTTLMTSQAMYQLTQTGFQETISAISNVNNTVVNLSKLAEPINIHIQNSSVFFNKMSEIIPDMQKTLHQIEENTRPISAQKKNTSTSKNRYSDIFDFEGNFDMNAWREMVKGKGKDSLGFLLGMASMATSMGGGKGTSVGKSMTQGIIDKLIPTMAKESMKAFNESLNGAISTAMVRGRRYANDKSGTILGQLLNILTPDLNKNTGISTSRYEKGPVAWDGKSRKALMEVIPTLLGDIYTAVSGQEARVFDYETGKFTKRSELRKLEAYNRVQEAKKAGGDFYKDAKDMVNEKYGKGTEASKKVIREIETYFVRIFEDPNLDPYDAFRQFEGVTKTYGLGEESWGMMRRLLDRYNKAVDQKRKNGSRLSNTFYKYQNDVIRAQQSYAKKMEDISYQGDSALNSIYNNSDSQFGKDNYYMNQMFYLQGIYEYTAFMAANLPYIGGQSNQLQIIGTLGAPRNRNSEPFDAARKSIETDHRIRRIRNDYYGSADNRVYTAEDFVSTEDDRLKYWGKSDAEIKAIKEKLERDKEMRENAKKIAKDINSTVNKFVTGSTGEEGGEDEEAKELNKLQKFAKGISSGIGKVKSWYEAPFAAMSNLFDTMTISINRFFLGDRNTEGFLESAKKSIKKFFDNIAEDESNGKGGFFKSFFGNLFKKIFGDKSLKESMKETWGGIKDVFSGKAKQAILGKIGLGQSNAIDAAQAEYDTLIDAIESFNYKGNAARGRRVSKSGLVSVSEGELIIPSDFNPYYHGSNDKRRQRRNEILNAKRFYGLMANGGTVGEGATEEFENSKLDQIINLVKLAGGGFKAAGNIVVDTAKDGSARFIKYINKNGKLDEVEVSLEEALEWVKNKANAKGKMLGNMKKKFTSSMKGEGNIDGIIPFLGKSVGTLTDGFQKVFNSIFGSDKEIEKEKNKISDVAAKALDSLGESKGAGAIGAIGGAGLSLLTGIMNPLAGAAIGGAIGITVKSKAVQDALFGEMDENGERDYEKGALPAAIGKFMDKQLGDIGIGAGLGAGAGFFMGSPVLGAVLGGTVGFVKSSEGAKNVLFGKMQYDKDGKPIGRDNTGLIPKDIREKLKENLGAIGAGSLIGAAVGATTPVGLVGGIALGGVGGLVATSDKFKTWMFGDGKDDKGFTGLLKEKVFKNIEDIGLNIMAGIKGHGKRLFNVITRRASLTIQKIGKFINDRLFHRPGTLLGKIGSGIATVAKAPFKLAGGVLEKGKEFTTNYNLRHGFDVYQGGQRLDAAGRLQLGAKGYANSNYGALDAALASIGSKEEMEVFQSSLEMLKNPKAAAKYSKNAVALVFSKLRISGGEKKQLTNLVIAGQYDQAKQLAAGFDPNLGVPAAVEEAIQINENTKDRNRATDIIKTNLKNRYKLDVDKQFNPNRGGIISAIDRTKSEFGRFDKDEATQAAENNENIATMKTLIESIKHEGIPVWMTTSGDIKDPIEKMIEERAQKMMEMGGEGAKSKGLEYWKGVARRSGVAERDFNAKKESFYTNAEQSANAAQPKTEIDPFTSQAIRYESDGQGGLRPDTSDAATKEALKKKSSMFGAISGLSMLGSGFKSLGEKFSDGFKSIKDKLFGEKEGKKGFLSTLLDMFTGGKDSILTGIGSFLSGLPGAGIIKGLTTGMTLPSILSSAFSIFGVFGTLSGQFDNFLHAAFPEYFGNKEKENIVTDENGNVLTADENGVYRDKDGNIIKNVSAKKGDIDSWSTRAKKAFGRQLISGNKSWVGATLGRNKLIRNAGNMIKNSSLGRVGALVGDTATYAAEHAGKQIPKLLAAELDDACLGLAKGLKRIPIVKGLLSDDMINSMSKSLSEVLQKAAVKLGPKAAQATSTLGKAIPFINIAFMIGDFTTGYEDARTTLGITKDPTTGQRILAGILRLVKNLIPIVGPLIPDSLVVNVVAKYIAPALGINVKELTDAQAAAEAEAKAAGYDSVAQYNKEVKQDYTWTERIGNSVKGVGLDIKQDFAAMKEQGLGAFVNNKASNMQNSFMDAFKAKNGGVAGIISGVGAAMGELLPGVIGEVFQKNAEIKALAHKGEVAQMWKVSLSDFSKGNSEQAVDAGIFSKAIGQIPLIVNKIAMTPVALMHKTFKPIVEVGEKMVNKIIDGFSMYTQQIQRGEEIFKDPNAKFTDIFDTSDVTEDPENPMGPLMKFAVKQARIASVPITLFKTMGRHIGEFFDGVFGSIKDDFGIFKQNIETMKDTDGIKDSLNMTLDIGYDSPLKGLFIGGTAIATTVSIIKEAATTVFGGLKNIASNFIDGVKADYNLIKDLIQKYKETNGIKDTIAVMTGTFLPFSSPISGIFNIISLATGIGYLLKNLFKDEDSPLGNALSETGEKIKNSKVGKFVGGLVNGGVNLINNTIGKGMKSYVGSGSNMPFVSQYDPRYSGQSFAGSNFADKGCGPAVAVMASNGRLSMSQAIAKSRKYQNGGGVSADYFADVLGGNVRYISGAGSTGGRVMSTLARGGKAILLGRNPRNMSKANSPFGPNNHYVLATGLDRNGNVIINDPEGYGPRAYNPAILGSVGMSMLSGGDSGIDTDIAKNVYGFLTGRGYSPGAAAGIMGNLYAESGMDPARQQNGGPAAGIAQWESFRDKTGRWQDMANYAASKGKDWTDLGSQLEFLVQELETNDMAKRMSGELAPSNLQKAGTTGMTYDQFKNSDDINATTRVFEAAFERAGKPHMDARLAAAKEYYNLYSGSQYTGSFDPAVGAAIGTAGAQTAGTSSPFSSTGSASTGGVVSAAKGLGILGAISNAFSKIGSIFTGGDKENNSQNLTGIDDNQNNNAANSAVSSGGALATSGSTVSGEMANNFPYYSQADSRWGSLPYGSHGTLSSSACGPTSMAMVLRSYGANVTPADTANWSASHGYRADVGTSWGFFDAIGKEQGLTTQQFNDSGMAAQMLDSGIPVIASMTAGHFTKGGHFIVLAGKNGDEILVNDPGKKDRTHGWPADIVFSEAKQYWAISKDGKGSIGNVSGTGQDYGKGNYNLGNANTAALMAMQNAGVRTDFTNTSGSNSAALMAQSAAGSGIGSGSRWILNSNFGTRRRRPQTVNVKTSRRFTGGDSGMYDERMGIIDDASNMLYNRAMSGDLSAADMNKGQEAIIAILKVIAQNTGFIDDLFQFLKVVLAGGGSKNNNSSKPDPKPAGSSKHMGRGTTGEVDASLRAAVMTLAAIAKG